MPYPVGEPMNDTDDRIRDIVYGDWLQAEPGALGPDLHHFSDAVVSKEFTLTVAAKNLNNWNPEEAQETMPESPDRVGVTWINFQVDGVEQNAQDNLSDEDKQRIRDEVNWVLDIIFSGQVRYKE